MNQISSFLKAMLVGVCLLFTIGLFGQNANTIQPQQADNGFFKIQREFNEYWAPYNVDNNGYYIENGVRKKAGGWKQFRRWEWFWENRINPVTGEFPALSAADVYAQQKAEGNRSAAGNWTSLGPNSSSGGYSGIGRINCVVEQTVSGDLYAGSPSGGLWKSTNGGSTWTVLTDHNAVLGVSSIVVVPTAGDDIIYIGTGDRDGGSMWSLSGGQSNDNNSIGVLKSTDGGSTWLPTGLTYSTSQKRTINRLVIDPNNSSIIYAATSDGIYKTTDGGLNWPYQILGGNFIDLEMHPTNSSILYASTINYSSSPLIYKTSNGGASWSVVATLAATDYRIEIAVTPANTNIVYGIVAKQDGGLSSIQKSTDTGASFSMVFNGTSKNMLGWYCLGTDAGGQGSYDLCIAADPGNANIVFIGGVNTWKSTNGGSAWTVNNMWTSSGTYNSCGAPVVHADKHDLVFFGSTLYEGNDGGLYKTTNGGSSWSHISNGMVTSQLYRLSVAQTTPNEVLAGLQDNGSKLLWSGTWNDVTGGDGMECLIDYQDINDQYTTYPRGTITKTTTHWSSTSNVTPSSAGTGAWVTPFVISPSNHNTLFAGYSDIWRTTNQGGSWTKISTINNADYVRSMAVAPSNASYIYAGFRNILYRTINGGTSWTNITGNLPVTSSFITYVSVKSDDPNTVWVSMGEYNSYGVFETTNGGSSWTDISAGLPNIPVMCVIQNKLNTTETELYAGTDVGVYAKVGSGNWFLFSSGLPNVVVTELEIYYDNTTPANSKLRAATFGRGLWESDLFTGPTAQPVADFNADEINPQVGQTVDFFDLSTANPNSWSWSFSPTTVSYVNSTSSSSQNPQIQFNAPGLYTVTLQATNSFGSDTDIKTDYIDAFDCSAVTSYPYSETFDSWPTNSPAAACTPDGSVLLRKCWTNVTGDNIDWNIYSGSTASGATGPSYDHTGGGNYLYTEASGCYANTGQITSPTFDLSGITDPELTFWYHMYGAGMGALSVQVSTDGGSSWSSDIWSISGDQGNSWHEQLISLDAYTAEDDLVFRFSGLTGATYQSDMAIDDFSITGIPIVTTVDQITALAAGWNMISFFVTPASLNMIDIFQPMIDNSTLVKISDEAGNFVQYIPGPGWMNTIGNMGNTEGYYINLTTAGSITTNGTPVTYPYDVALYAGWNIMSYPCDVSQTAMTVLQPLIDNGYLVKVLSESGGIIQFITGLGWINTIVNFVPGEGYYINVSTNTTLSYTDPLKSALPQTFPPAHPPTAFFAGPASNPFSPMNIIVRDIHSDGFIVEEGDEVAVYDGELLAGSAVILFDGKGYQSIIARSDDPVTEMTDGFTTGNEITFSLWDKSENMVYTNIEATHLDGDQGYNPLGTYVGELKVSSLGAGEPGSASGTFLGQNFPNPYNENTRIKYGIAEDADVTISVHDVSGRTVKVLQNGHLAAGKYHVDMNKATLEAGIYYYRMEVRGSSKSFSETRKMVLL